MAAPAVGSLVRLRRGSRLLSWLARRGGEPRSSAPRASHFDKGHVRDGAAAWRRVVATWARRLAPRSGPALRLDAARFAQFFLPRLRRPVRIVEAELAVAGLVGDDDDTDMAAALEPAEQNLVGKSLLD